MFRSCIILLLLFLGSHLFTKTKSQYMMVSMILVKCRNRDGSHFIFMRKSYSKVSIGFIRDPLIGSALKIRTS